MVTILAVIFVLGVLIFIHEAGHFLAAKLLKIRVERFSLGYPPRIVGRKIGETDYCISAIPFGGYVKIAGMVDESLDKETLKKSPSPWEFRSRPFIQKFLVLSAGPLMNLVFAFLVFVAVNWMVGVEEKNGVYIGNVLKGKPAERAGLMSGDRIVAVDGKRIDSWEDLTEIISVSAGRELVIEYLRGDSLHRAKIVPEKEKIKNLGESVEVGRIGISSLGPVKRKKVGVFASIYYGGVDTWKLTKLTFVTIYRLITGHETIRSLAGPIGIAKMAGESARLGIGPLILFMALLSLNLAVLNLLPFPALDGGHILIVGIEGVIRREIPLRVRVVIQQIGMILLLALMIFVVYNDILRVTGH